MGSSVQVYVVQVWTTGPGFRAQVRTAQAEHVQTFDDPLALLEHLRSGTPPTHPTSPPDRPTGDRHA